MGILWATCMQAQELIPYRKCDKWWFCTLDKKIVIAPKYDDGTRFFDEGLAWVLVAQLPLNSKKAHNVISINMFKKVFAFIKIY